MLRADGGKKHGIHPREANPAAFASSIVEYRSCLISLSMIATTKRTAAMPTKNNARPERRSRFLHLLGGFMSTILPEAPAIGTEHSAAGLSVCCSCTR